MHKYYGVSRGDTGEYGIGDIVVGLVITTDVDNGGKCLDGEPVYHIFKISDSGEIEYV